MTPRTPRKKKLEGLIWTVAGLAFVVSSVIVACGGVGAQVNFFVAVGLLITGCFLAITGLKKLDNANRDANRDADRWRRL